MKNANFYKKSLRKENENHHLWTERPYVSTPPGGVKTFLKKTSAIVLKPLKKHNL
jgi:hypothetical protein